MKELSIEEKAKRYDEALEKASKLRVQNPFDTVSQMIEYVFPNLKENEDEKIRKAIIEFFELQDDNTTYSFIPKKDIIAWLEKHKYTEEDLNKAYKCADEVQYRRGYEDAKKEIEKQGEHKQLKKIEQEYHCTGVREPKEATGVLKQLLNKENYAWSDDDEELFTISLDNLIELNDRYGEEYGRVGECIRWFKSIKDRVQPQPKQEWSEEDKVKINRIVAFLENLNLKKLKIIDDNNTFKKDVDWLKSIRDKCLWKPSEEQMDALETAISSLQSTTLESLYNKLKKLKD